MLAELHKPDSWITIFVSFSITSKLERGLSFAHQYVPQNAQGREEWVQGLLDRSWDGPVEKKPSKFYFISYILAIALAPCPKHAHNREFAAATRSHPVADQACARSYDGVDFDWIAVPDTDIWLPSYQQLTLIMDHNCMNPNVNFRRLIVVLTPLIEEFMKNLLVEYVYATVSKSADSCNGYPSAEQVNAAKEFGLTMSLWAIGPYQHLTTFHGQRVDMAQIRLSHNAQYMEKINPVWTMLARAIYPTLKPKTMEPEYTAYACRTRLKVEELATSGQLADLRGEYRLE
ncbi:hypothetical protein B0H14DRAFT_2567892 [Mycena olivaceomarginata]|nr:hypothetical protein B0H14DRAFT_2567892 [Mycena olivaceomarginata]